MKKKIHSWGVFLLTLYIPVLCFARSEIIPYKSDTDIVDEAPIIVEGTVELINPVPQMFFSSPCFEYVYKFKIKKSLKGSYKAGDYLNIGSSSYLGKTSLGGHQLLILRNASKSTYANCSIGKLEKSFDKLEIKMPYFGVSSVFHITNIDEIKKEFKSVNCIGSRQLMFSSQAKELGFFLEEFEVGGSRCAILRGSYETLYQSIIEKIEGKN